MERHVNTSVSAVINYLQSCTLFLAATMRIDSGDNPHQRWTACSAGQPLQTKNLCATSSRTSDQPTLV